MFINKISNSKQELIKQCKLKYKYKYIDKFVGESRNEEALNFGSFIHKVLEEGVEADSLDELLTIAEAHKKTYKISFDHRDLTETCLKNFLKFNRQLKETVGVEFNYTIEIADGIESTGIIDRIVQGDKGGILIIDYKTSKREKTRFELFKDGQLMGYAFAVSKEFGVPLDKITCAHFYPRTGNLVAVRYSKSQVVQHVKNLVGDVWIVTGKQQMHNP